MHEGKYVFSQLIELLPQKYDQRLVVKYGGDRYVKHFSCWNHLLVGYFGQTDPPFRDTDPPLKMCVCVGFPFLVQFKNRINDSYFNNFLFQEGLCGAKA